jgi:hypothetical protein
MLAKQGIWTEIIHRKQIWLVNQGSNQPIDK